MKDGLLSGIGWRPDAFDRGGQTRTLIHEWGMPWGRQIFLRVWALVMFGLRVGVIGSGGLRRVGDSQEPSNMKAPSRGGAFRDHPRANSGTPTA